MSYRLNNDWRGNRNYQIGNIPPAFGTMHYSIASYCTDKSSSGLSTESNIKSDLNETLTSEAYLAQLQRLSNPLQKNLADTLPNMKAEKPKNMTANYRHSRQKSFDFDVRESNRPAFEDNRAEYSTLSGIGSFISNVFNVITQAMPFHRRQRNSSSVNLDESDAPRDSSPPLVTWPKSNLDIQNKNKTQSQTHNHITEINDEFNTKMNKECLSAASQCEGKLATVRLLLANKVAATKPVPVKARRPRRIFVPPNSVEKVFEDAFNSEEYERMSNSQSLEHITPSKNIVQHYVKLNCPKVNIQPALDVKDVDKPAQDNETISKPINCDKETVFESDHEISSEMTINEVANPKILISNDVFTPNAISTDNLPLAPSLNSLEPNLEDLDNLIPKSVEPDHVLPKSEEPDHLIPKSKEIDNFIPEPEETNVKTEIVTSCEDKLNRLKALLLERKLNSKSSKQPATEPKEIENQPERSKQHKKHSKKHKNPNRTTDKREKCYQNITIKEDMSFAKEIDTDISSSLDNSPQPYKGKLSGLSHTLEKPTNSSINGDVENSSKALAMQESPIDCIFDEVSGRFRNSSTTESEDSFQIVFTDNLKPTVRSRKLSDCDSEDSFIVFEDSPDSCYVSTDIFGGSDDDSETSSSECDSDSGNEVCKLNHAFSRTVSDLTDACLYEPGGFKEQSVCLDSEDEVDSAVRLGDVIQSDLIEDNATLIKDSATLTQDNTTLTKDSNLIVNTPTLVVKKSADEVGASKAPVVKNPAALFEDSVGLAKDIVVLPDVSAGLVEDSVFPEEDSGLVEDSDLVSDDAVVPKETGLLLTDEKKLQKRLAGPRKVRFSEAPPRVHVMRVWQFAARQARAGHWDRYALDRERFQRRIADVDMAISWVLKPQHRSRVKFQRFMPWWHAQRRKEAAEKKLLEEQEKIRKEEEERRKIEEEERMKEEEERKKAEELIRIENSINFPEEVSVNGKLDFVSDKPANDIDKKDLLIITNKCLLNVDSLNEIKMQISNEVKQLLASSDDEFKSSSSDIAKRRKKGLNKKNATMLNKNCSNDDTIVGPNRQTNCQTNKNCSNDETIVGPNRQTNCQTNKNCSNDNTIVGPNRQTNCQTSCHTNCQNSSNQKKSNVRNSNIQ